MSDIKYNDASNAPETIYAHQCQSPLGYFLNGKIDTEKSDIVAQVKYTRADIAAARIAELEATVDTLVDAIWKMERNSP